MHVWIMSTYHVKNIWAAAGVCCVLILSGVLSGCFPTEKRNTADLETEILSGSQELAGEKPVTRLREIPETVSEESEEVSIQARVDIGNREAVLEFVPAAAAYKTDLLLRRQDDIALYLSAKQLLYKA